MMSDRMLSLTDENFTSEVLRSDLPVLVDFTAQWCPPCRQIAPTIEKLAEAYVGRLKVGAVDADSNQQTLIQFGVQALPTLLFFLKGEVVDQLVGAHPQQRIQERIDALFHRVTSAANCV